MKIRLALVLLLASAAAHAEVSSDSDRTPPPARTQGHSAGVGQSPAAGAESVGEDELCHLPDESFIDRILALLASAECHATPTDNLDAER